MSLYETWVQSAYDAQGNTIKRVWDVYLPLEQKIYEDMLATKNPVIAGVLGELAVKHDMTAEFFVGFLDGISGALDAAPDVEELNEESEINVNVDFEALYRRMVDFKARHLLDLPQWDNVYSAEERERLFKEQRAAKTVVREGAKVGRNDPCPCESGKKYKKCCGAA